MRIPCKRQSEQQKKRKKKQNKIKLTTKITTPLGIGLDLWCLINSSAIFVGQFYW